MTKKHFEALAKEWNHEWLHLMEGSPTSCKQGFGIALQAFMRMAYHFNPRFDGTRFMAAVYGDTLPSAMPRP